MFNSRCELRGFQFVSFFINGVESLGHSFSSAWASEGGELKLLEGFSGVVGSLDFRSSPHSA